MIEFEVVRNPIGTLKVDNEDKDTYSLNYVIRKAGICISLTPYELDHIIKEATPYLGKSTITE